MISTFPDFFFVRLTLSDRSFFQTVLPTTAHDWRWTAIWSDWWRGRSLVVCPSLCSTNKGSTIIRVGAPLSLSSLNTAISRLSERFRKTPRVRLQAYKKTHAFPSHCSDTPYRIGPAESIPTTWYGLGPLVRVVGKFPGEGAAYAIVWNRLHPWQAFRTFLTSYLNFGT